MLDLNYVAANLSEVIDKLNQRGGNYDNVKTIVKVYQEWKKAATNVATLQHEHNVLTKEFATVIHKSNINKQEVIVEYKQKLNDLKQKINDLKEKANQLEQNWRTELYKIPNVPDASVPVGKDETENKIVKVYGENNRKKSSLPHWEIAKKLNMADFDRAVKLASTRFLLYQNDGAALLRALINFLIHEHLLQGYQEIAPPYIVNEKMLFGTGQLPKFKADLFELKGDSPAYLIPTGEVPLVGLHANEIIDYQKLPLKYCAYTACFREEAGAAGRDTRGFIRLHQFNKIELVKITTPDNSEKELELLVKEAGDALTKLGLPYRIVSLCTGDIGFSAVKTYDLEVWMPGQKLYREISSCSNCGDFQARRLMIRYKSPDDDKNKYVHTLNGSGLALDRLMAALIETYYNPTTNKIDYPDILLPYLAQTK